MDNNQEGLTGLPLLKKEKVVRFLTHMVAPAVVAVTAVNFFMPSINKALRLLVDGAWSAAELGIAASVAFAVIFGAVTMWPVYRRFMESLANKATWKLFEWDPITPMELWIEKEVVPDNNAINLAYTNLDGVVSSNEHRIGELRTKSQGAQTRFNVAVSKYGKDSHQANMASIDVGTPNQTADEIERSNVPLRAFRDMIQQVCEASEFTLHQAQAQVEGAKVQWAATQEGERASNAAFRVLRGKSQRSIDAQKAMELVRNRYGSQFGRVRALRKLADSMFNEIDLQKGVFQQEALANFQRETQLLTGKQLPLVEVVPQITTDASKVSLYR